MRSSNEMPRRHTILVLTIVLFAACSEVQRRASTEPGVAATSYNIADLVAPRDAGVALSVPGAPVPGASASRLPGEGEVELISNGSFEHNGGLGSPDFPDWSNYDEPAFDTHAFRVQSSTRTSCRC